MDLKKAAPYMAIYVLIALAIPLFFSGSRFTPFPEAELYSGDLLFSGARAFSDLQALVEAYPARYAGTRAARTSAQWVQEQLNSLGLDARIEEFDCLIRERGVQSGELLTVPAEDLTYHVTGYNVVAVSPGKTQETIVIGAHRDMAGNGTGAEDNGSGTVSVIELARSLVRTGHYYTYLFASWDGEESGLRGSEAFARSHSDLPVRLAVALDMTGFNRADTVGFLPFVSSKSASPFWTVVLARDLAVAKGLPLFYYGAADGDTRSPVLTFWGMRTERLTGRVPTDSGPFIDRGIPALGVIAAESGGSYGEGRIASIHNPDDTIEQVSVATLEASGKFVEQYILSVELNRFSGPMNSRLYFVSGDKVLAPGVLTGLNLYIILLALAMAGLSWRDSGVRPAAFGHFLRAECPWLASTLAVTLVVAAFPALLRISLAARLPLSALHTMWAAIALGGTGAVVYLRGRALGKRDLSYHDTAAQQKLLLNAIYLLAFLSLMALANPFVAVSCGALPILFLGRISFRSEGSRVLWSAATVGWVLFCIFNLRGQLTSAVFYPTTGALALLDVMRTGIWTLTPVYILVTPRRGATRSTTPS